MHALVVAGLLVAGTAAADPRPLPFGHSTETVLPGDLRVTQIADLVPLTGDGDATVLGSAFQTELEAGVLDRLEVAFAFTHVARSFEDVGRGLRQRAKYVVIQPGDWWIDLAILGETTQNEHRLELEGRAIVRAVFDRLKLVGNAGVEYALPWQGGEDELVWLGTLAATFEIVPAVVIGTEGFVRDHATEGDTLALRPQLYVGPVVQARLGKLGVTAGAYARATDREREVTTVDTFGRYWFRMLVSFDL